MPTGVTPSATAASCAAHPTVTTRSGALSITASPSAVSMVTGNASPAPASVPDDGASSAGPAAPPEQAASVSAAPAASVATARRRGRTGRRARTGSLTRVGRATAVARRGPDGPPAARGGSRAKANLTSRSADAAAGEALEGLEVAVAGAEDDVVGQRGRRCVRRPVPPGRRRGEPVPDVLLVEARLRAAGRPGIGGPEPGGVRGEDLVPEDDVGPVPV